MRLITIHKATHKFFAAPGTIAIAVGQLRGDSLYLNRIDPITGKVVEKTRAISSCAYHLTGYGKGVEQDDTRAVRDMQAAWFYMFGPDIAPPAFCEVHKES